MNSKSQWIAFATGLAFVSSCGGGGEDSTPACTPSPRVSVMAVHANQLGFRPDTSHHAIVVTDATAPLTWTLLNAVDATVASGQTQRFGLNTGSNQVVHRINFSTFSTPGTDYVLEVNGVRSHPFTVAPDVYNQLKYDALAFFYHQRSGVAIEPQYAGTQWARPIAHHPDVGGCIEVDFHGNDWGGCGYELDVTRGWYDAADHGKCVVNGGIAAWTLMNYFERIRTSNATLSAFDDGSLRIPERANGLPDLLDEVRWEMDFLLAMQVPDGTTLTLPLGNQSGNLDALTFTSVNASGLAHHKFHDMNWTALPMPPHLDTQTRYLSYPSTAATLNLAATAAQCARLFRELDDAYADRCLAAARRAHDAAERVPNAFAIDITQGGGGGYGDSNVSDEFYWAACELFITTGEARYESDMRASQDFLAVPAGVAGATTRDVFWADVHALGTISLAVAASNVTGTDQTSARNAVIGTADAYLAQMDHEGYALPFSRPYMWGSNGDMATRGMILALAFDFTANARHRDGVVAAMDYLLGRNPLDRSSVASYGARPMVRPHHRFWAHSLDASLPPPPAGALAGGSNNQTPADDVAKLIFTSCLPQTCYRDEVAINWNAPLLWIAAFLDENQTYGRSYPLQLLRISSRRTRISCVHGWCSTLLAQTAPFTLNLTAPRW